MNNNRWGSLFGALVFLYASVLGADGVSSLVISKLLTAPVRENGGYVEVRNISADETVSLDGVRLEGDVAFTFPSGTRLAPLACLALAADEATYAALYPTAPAPLGVYTGSLKKSGGEVRLVRAARATEFADPVLDRVAWSAAWGWPTPAAGQPLVLIRPGEDRSTPANWIALDGKSRISRVLVDWNASWRYLCAAAPEGWQAPGFDDSSWAAGTGPLGYETSSAASGWEHPLVTSFSLEKGRITYYFRTTFTNDGTMSFSELSLRYMVDDAARYYLNGVEVARSALLTSGTVTDETLASGAVDPEGVIYGPVSLSLANLRTGVNTLAVEVHQNDTGSTDLVTGTCLTAAYAPGITPLPGVPSDATAFRPRVPRLRIVSLGSASATIRNGESEALSLDGWSLGDVMLSGQLGAGASRTVSLSPPSGFLLLRGPFNDETLVVDAVPSPAKPAAGIVINEVAGQNALVVNPVTGTFDDWFELANPQNVAVDLSGWLVTDTLAASDPPAPNTRAAKSLTIPSGVVLQPGEHLRIWTGGDVTNETDRTSDPAALQAPFGLNKRVDTLYLFDAGLRLVDTVEWNEELAPTNSFGRWPDMTGDWRVLPVPTPGLPNRPPRFTQALISAPAPVSLAPGESHTFTVDAPSDVTWRLLPVDELSPVPSAFAVDSLTGTVTWQGAATGAYRAMLCAFSGDTCIDAVCLVVTVRAADTSKPTLQTNTLRPDNGELYLTFSELLGAAAFDIATWTQGSLPVQSVRPIANGRGVALVFSEPLSPGTDYPLAVGVPDAAGNTRALSLTVRAPVFLSPPKDAVRGVREPVGPASRRNPLAVTEIAARPAPRTDGRDLRFLELYNSAPYAQRVGGYTLSGGLSYTFPAGAQIPAQTFVVIAPSPEDIAAVYGLSDVRAAIDNGFSPTAKIELRDEIGAQLAKIEPDGKWPWPAGADGSGHTLVLARPTYGQSDPKAWSRSAQVGGSPGAADPVPNEDGSLLLVNEYRAHSPEADGYIELVNVGDEAFDLTGCQIALADTSSVYTIPSGIVPVHGYILFTEETLGFRLPGTACDVLLRRSEAAGGAVIDAFRVPNLELDRAFGRTPDGGPMCARLAYPTPLARNAMREIPPVVLNEIMYNPISGSSDDEYVELLNLTDEPIDLDGWTLSGGIDHTFSTVIPARGFKVAPAKKSAFKALYPKQADCLDDGAYSGSLGDRGDTLRLRRPLIVWDAETDEPILKNVILEEVTYCDGGLWGHWADGGGSSLERVDPRADARLAAAWADSDESDKSEWKTIAFTGPLEYGRPFELGSTGKGYGEPLRVEIGLYGEGECLVDSVHVAMEGGSNYVLNPSFEEPNTTWSWVGTHQDSRIETRSDADDGARVLHLRASGRLHTGGNGVRGLFEEQMPTNGRATVSMRVKWLAGSPDALLRVRGNWIEASGTTITTFALGSPGKRNSRAGTAVPDVTECFHLPAMPRADEMVQVWARINAPDGLTSVTLEWALDDSLSTNRVTMLPSAGGWYRGVISGSFPSGTLAAYHVVASAANEYPRAAVFPEGRDCLVSWGESTLEKAFGTYRVWMTKRAIAAWTAQNNDNNKPNPFTFVYGNGERIIQRAGMVYGGSPLHMQSYSKPFSGDIDYIMDFPKDDLLLGDDGAVLCTIYESSEVMEQFNYSLLRKLGLPSLYRRYVRLIANGKVQSGRGIVEDTEKPGGDMLKHWYPDDKSGQLMKINEWYEYDIDTYAKFSKSYDFTTHLQPGATLEAFRTTDETGAVSYRTARYRWHWQRRSYKNFEPSDYTEFWKLVDVLNAPSPSLDTIRQVVDLDAFLGVPAVNHFVGNWDTYGFQRGKNMYIYKGEAGWGLVGWDMDIGLDADQSGRVIDPQRISASDIRDPAFRAFLRRPDISRWWWRKVIKLLEAAAPGSEERDEAEAKNLALRADGISAGNITNRFTNITARYESVAAQRTAVDAAEFCLFSPQPGSTVTIDSSVCTLEGLAPFLVTEIVCNGEPLVLTWATPTNWVAQLPLKASRTAIALVAHGEDGTELGRASAEVVTTAPVGEDADGQVIFSEILARPSRAGGGYVEVRNLSESIPCELGGWYLEGDAEALFPTGTILAPGGCLVVAENPVVFAEVFGRAVIPAAFFASALPPVGELRLRRPAKGSELADPVIDRVTWGGTGWPEAAADEPFVLLDARAENNAPANWTNRVVIVREPEPAKSLIGLDHSWRYWTAGFPGEEWAAPDFDDSAWPRGMGPLGHDSNSKNWAIPIRTDFPMTSGRITYYFRTTFTNSVPINEAQLLLSYLVDDGAVIYLNGREMARSSLMPDGVVGDSTVARDAQGAEGVFEGPFTLEAEGLRMGENVLAVEVHQNGGSSTDLSWCGLLSVTNIVPPAGTPGVPDDFTSPTAVPRVYLNEVGPAQTELYNADTISVSLEGWTLAQGEVLLPLSGDLAPGSFCSIPFARGEGELHLLKDGALVDLLLCANLNAGAVFGRFPDGADEVRLLNPETPGAANRSDPPDRRVVLNELMSQNGLFENPATGEKDDWFELANVGLEAVDLEGWIVTDTLTGENPPVPSTKASKALIFPSGVTLAPGEVLRVWTGSAAAAEPFDRENPQAPFGLGKSGDQIFLFDADLALIDSVAYTREIAKTNAFGRWPHGTGGWTVLPIPTPGLPNRPPRFTQALFASPAVFRLEEGGTCSFANTLDGVTWALMPVEAGQGLAEGLRVDPLSGVVTFEGGVAGSVSAVLCAFQGETCVDAVTLVFTVTPAGTLRISAFTSANGLLSLAWEAQAGAAYIVETAPTPCGPWSEVPNTLVTSSHVAFEPPSGVSSAFFRVKRVR